MLIEDIRKDINSFLKDLQKNMGQQIEALKGERQKSLKEFLENTNKHGKELNNTIQDLNIK